jgi:hypothetical protein
MIATCIARADMSPEERAKLIADALHMASRRGIPLSATTDSPPRLEDESTTSNSWQPNPFATPSLASSALQSELESQLAELRQLRDSVQSLESQLQAQSAEPRPARKSAPFQLPSFQREIEVDIRPELALAQEGLVTDRLSDASPNVAALPREGGIQNPSPLSPSLPPTANPLLPRFTKSQR